MSEAGTTKHHELVASNDRCVSTHVLEAGSLSQGTSRAVIPLRALGNILPRPFMVPGGCGPPSVPERAAAPLLPRCHVVLSLYFYIPLLSLLPDPSYKDIIIRLGLTLIQYDLILTRLHVQRPYLRTRSRSQVRVDTHLGGDANQRRCLSQWGDITWRHHLES